MLAATLFMLALLAAPTETDVEAGSENESSESVVFRLGEIEHRYFSYRSGEIWTQHEYPGGHRNELDLALLFTVKVEGTPGDYVPEAAVSIKATRDGERMFDRRYRVGVLGPYGTFTLPALVYGPFCEEVAVHATLEGPDKTESKAKTLHFTCGE